MVFDIHKISDIRFRLIDTVVIKRPIMDGRSPTHNRNTAGSKNGTSKSNASDRTNTDENVDPIGYQAIVLDPNPKAVCQLLGKFMMIQFGSHFSIPKAI